MLAKLVKLVGVLSIVTSVHIYAQEVDSLHSTPDPSNITDVKRSIAQDISTNYEALKPLLISKIDKDNPAISLSQLQSNNLPNSFHKNLLKAEHQFQSLKGISDSTQSLMELRIANKSMLDEWKKGAEPLIAFEPSGNESSWQYIEAYDVTGQLVTLDIYNMPKSPVFVVDSDRKQMLQVGLATLSEEIQKLGVKTYLVDDQNLKPQIEKASQNASTEPLDVTQLTKIRLNDDKEPWISGKAEIYAIVVGIDPSADEGNITIVEMPYLDYDNTDYYPNQTMILWPRYRWGAVDMVLMEQDDGTNYKDLAKLLVEAIGDVLKTIPDVNAQGYSVLAQITNKIIDVLPDAWFTNDDDYVDVYYTLMKDQTYIDHLGASSNAKASFKPLIIPPTN
ncbi:DUF3103 domain-containing protein [Vibrio sp. S4M6]|uniref:DUF3103 family protein n=1 Tax=Vibrio sinus TaxID=2946865 RepID=UPI00202AB8A7|nr:DUF3103 family protein [Vibrio sinus]MCL9781324.1 DUF3103 domain-containing protein [Vibrio sinus]